MKSNRCISALVLLIALSISAAPAGAAPPASGTLSIGGTPVVTGGTTVATSGSGWAYDDGANILTLNNYSGVGISAAKMDTLTIQLAPGTANNITGGVPTANVSNAGIYADNTALNVKGGSGAALNIAPAAAIDLGIFLASTDYSSHLPITIDNAKINIDTNADCIAGSGDVNIINGSAVDLYGHQYYCIDVNNVSSANVNISNSTVNANAQYAAIGCDNINIGSGTVTVASHNVSGASAILVWGNPSGTINISGGKVTATTNSIGQPAIGATGYSSAGAVNISGGKVTAINSGGGGVSIGAYNPGYNVPIDVNISGGTTVAPNGITSNRTVVTGGSLSAPQNLVSNPVDGGGRSVLRTDITLKGAAADTKATSITGAPVGYGTNDIYIDSAGTFYPWFPAGNAVTQVAGSDGYDYYGSVGAGMAGELTRKTATTPVTPAAPPSIPPTEDISVYPLGWVLLAALSGAAVIVIKRRNIAVQPKNSPLLFG